MSSEHNLCLENFNSFDSQTQQSERSMSEEQKGTVHYVISGKHQRRLRASLWTIFVEDSMNNLCQKNLQAIQAT